MMTRARPAFSVGVLVPEIEFPIEGAELSSSNPVDSLDWAVPEEESAPAGDDLGDG